MTVQQARCARADRPDEDHAVAEHEHAQHERRSAKNYAIRPVLRNLTLLGGALGTTGASLGGHQLIAISTLLVTAAIIAGEMWIAKRRDDLFNKIVTQREVDPAVVRAVTIHEAVRSGLLSSADTVRLLRDRPTGRASSASSEPIGSAALTKADRGGKAEALCGKCSLVFSGPLPPLRSAEPPPATQAQHDELILIAGEEIREISPWITELAARRRELTIRLSERRSLLLPAEDLDYAGYGLAFPAWTRSRSLQPGLMALGELYPWGYGR